MSGNNTGTTPPTPRITFSAAWAGAAAFLAIILVIAVTIMISRNTGGNEETKPAPPPETGQPVGGFHSSITDVWGNVILRPVNPEGEPLNPNPSRDWEAGHPITAPVAIEWQLTAYGALPFSGDGPYEVADCRAKGYSRTPQGAALAAVQLRARASWCDSDSGEGLIDEQLVTLDARNRVQPLEDLVRARVIQGWREHATSLEAEGVTRSQAAQYVNYKYDAFRIESFDRNRAAIDVATRLSDHQWSVARLHVVWHEGDWKYIPDAGEKQNHLNALPEGWVQW
ncbi:hypothetical protein [Hoyosella altamirensis]|uniref:DUF8175 domain-containing protein n=1 Tax=Hoyosella altamirensis TaxID=616997 RepID=A0A839RV37_9ACTN|nr:hypothetical protein [Hoyosella altamirensis]MBB3040088.1 hypothetical protein [Hoyosella altamirensis]